MRLRREFRNAASLAASASYAIACANSDLPGRQVSKCVLKRQRVSRHARFEVEFVDELGVKRIIRLSMVLGYPRLIRALRCPSGSANSSSLS
jgi:hypothetical protein